MISEAENSLIASCLKEDRTAQHRLYQLYCDAMYNICYRMMGNSAEAEDALQESFIYIFKNLQSFRGDSTLGAWIKRIVINHCINQLKRSKIVFEEIKDYHETHYYETDQNDEYDAADVHRIKKAIMTLPDGYRQVLTLYLLEGFDHAEIAGILGIQETGSKSQYSRAKAKLRELLKRGISYEQ